MATDQFPFSLLSPPQDLPEYDESKEAEISYIGNTLYLSGMYQTNETFGINRADRNRHVYILGKSGQGKSFMMENLIRSDINYGYGVCVIDPHGDLAKSILLSIPDHRVGDVVYVNPADLEYPIAFNPFRNVPLEQRQQVARGLVEIFKKQFASTWTPRIEHLFRFATLAMIEYEEGTLYGLLQLITDAQYRQHVLPYITDDVTKRFFSVEFPTYSQKYDQEAITPLVNRLGQFFSDPLMRAIFTNPENKIDIADIMNQSKILVINMSKGILGEENSALFGSFFLTKIEQSAMARSEMAKEDRPQFYLYVDEFQNVATESFTSLFSESRKYAINITIANQYLTQIEPKLADAILGNAGTMIMFRLGGQDSQRIAMEFQPELEAHDFLNLGVGQFYIKMTLNGKTLQPFSATSLRIDTNLYPENMRNIIEQTRTRFQQSSDYQASFSSSDALAASTPLDTLDLPPPL